MGTLRAPIRLFASSALGAVITLVLMFAVYDVVILKNDVGRTFHYWLPCICMARWDGAPPEVTPEPRAEVPPLPEVEPFDPAVLAGDPVVAPEFEMPVVEPFPAVAIVGGCTASAIPLNRTKPQLPRITGLPTEGYALIGFDILPDGSVGNARVLETDLPGVVGDAFVGAVQTWIYLSPTNERGERCTRSGETSRIEYRIAG